MKDASYTFADIPDKTKEGIYTETSKGLAIAAHYFETSLGVPLESFQDMLDTECPTNADRVLWYMKFRNLYPILF